MPRGCLSRGLSDRGSVSDQGMSALGWLPRGCLPNGVSAKGVGVGGVCLGDSCPGGCLPVGVCLEWCLPGLSAQGDLPRGVTAWGVCIPAYNGANIPSLWTAWQTDVKTLPCPKLNLRTVKTSKPSVLWAKLLCYFSFTILQYTFIVIFCHSQFVSTPWTKLIQSSFAKNNIACISPKWPNCLLYWGHWV